MRHRKIFYAAFSAASLLILGTGMMSAVVWPDARVGSVQPAQHQRAFPSGAVFHTTENPIVNEQDIAVPDSSTILMLWEEVQPDGTRVAFYAIGRDGGEDAAGQLIGRVRQTEYTIGLRYANFDPMQALPQVDIDLAADEGNELYLVQFWTVPLDEFREQIETMGGKIYRFMPNHTHIVRMPLGVAAQVSQWPQVRWLGAFHTAYKLDDVILSSLAAEMPEDTTARYMIEVFERDATREVIELPADGDDASGAGAVQEVLERGTGQLRAVKAAVEVMGAVVHNIRPGQFWLEATLTPAQLLQVVRMNEVHFIEPWPGPMEMDMNIVREVGGADYLEGQTAATGQGVRGEVFDSELRVTHQEFSNNAPLIHSPAATPGTAHGTSVYSILFARGASANARGLLPDADQGIFYRGADSTYFGGGDKSRLQIAQDLAGAPYNAVFQTSSLGLPRTTVYTANSAEMDDVVFMTQVLHTQSQSNAGCCANPQASRPAAWSKNTVSGGAVNHFDTAGRADDTWKNGVNCSNPSCGTSIGPAADGRIKPDLCFFFDRTLAASRTNNSSYTQFGGTSGATPSIAGYMGLFHQMWHEGVWAGSGGLGSVFASRPKPMTAKAALINSAFRYDWNLGGPNGSITRFVQGWGMPNLETLYDARNETYFVNETHLLSNGGRKIYTVKVAPGEPELNVTMVYLDPMGTTSATMHRINDLSLCVISPGGVSYWGNRNLTTGNFSTPGGASDVKNTVENVFIANPEPGPWRVHVLADEIVQDSHTETGATDADYALWVSGATESNCLTTTYSTNNGHHGAMFDITASETITITGFDYQQRSAGGGRSDDIEVYYWPTGSYVGHENSNVGWVLMGTETVAGVGDGAATHVDIGGLTINAGQTRGIYFTINSVPIRSLAYTNTTGTVTYDNGEIVLELGIGKSYPWDATFNNRQWNGTVCYRKTSATINEIPAMTVDNTCIDMDDVGPAGPTSVARINAGGSPQPGNIANITLTRPTASDGVYNTQTGRGRALGGNPDGNLGLWLVDPDGDFGAFGSMIIDLGMDSTQFGFSIGDWNGAANVIVYMDGEEIGHLDGIDFQGSPDPHFILSSDPFDRVEITLQPQFPLGNWVVPDLCVQVPARGQLRWFTDKNAFEAAARARGKLQKDLSEDYEASILLPNQVDGFNDSLLFGVPNLPDGFPYPNGTDKLRNLITQSNNLGNAGVVPSPAGNNGLAAGSIGFLGFTSDQVVSNTFVNGLDLIFRNGKTAVGGRVVDALGPQTGVVITVYSDANVALGNMLVPGDAGGSSFTGVISDGAPIGRLNLFSAGAEGMDDIQAWVSDPHTVWDFVWSNSPVRWGAGRWTLDGNQICTTFPGGVTTGAPGFPDHDQDHVICPDWPNDWHWTYDIVGVCRGEFWFVWQGNVQIGVEIYCSQNAPEVMIEVNIIQDVYVITDAINGRIIFQGIWSQYPNDLPPDWQPTGAMRMNFEECDPCDMNCDGVVNAEDIEPFIGLLFLGDEPCDPCTGDTNGDGMVNAEDIEGFINCLFP